MNPMITDINHEDRLVQKTFADHLRDALGEERLRQDLGDESEGPLGLSAKAGPVLAELWDNPKDAAYDRI